MFRPKNFVVCPRRLNSSPLFRLFTGDDSLGRLLWGCKNKINQEANILYNQICFNILKYYNSFGKHKLWRMYLCVSLCCLMLRLDRGDIGAYGRRLVIIIHDIDIDAISILILRS